MEESCGKCTPCRVGTQKTLEVLTRICNGNGKENDIATLERWSAILQNAALCGLGQTAPNPVLSTLRYFREEFESHIFKKRCPAGSCRALVAQHALEDRCLTCLEAVAGYDAGGYAAFREVLPELVSADLFEKIMTQGCVVELARFSLIVPSRNQSCTKCTSCRIGVAQAMNILDDIAIGNGRVEMLDLLVELIDTIKTASECPVGRTAPDIVQFTLEHFRDQFEKHILEKDCPFGICREVPAYSADCPFRASQTA